MTRERPGFRKSRFSGDANDCVEVADLPGGARLVRDSKDPSGPVLRFSASAWRRFTDAVKDHRA